MYFPSRPAFFYAALLMAFFALPHAAAQKMITFESHNLSERSSHHTRKDAKNSLTAGIASAAAGYTPFYYERTITPFLTIQAGAGFTYRSMLNDLGEMIYNTGSNNDNFNVNLLSDIADDYSAYKFRKAGIGQYFSLSPKFYLQESALDGGYIGPMVEYKRFVYKARLADESINAKSWYAYDDVDVPHSSNTMNEYMRCIDFTFQAGGHFQTCSGIAVGWSAGFGVRSLTAGRLDIGMQRDSYDSNSDRYFVNATRTFSATRPLMVFNFIMGGCF